VDEGDRFGDLRVEPRSAFGGDMSAIAVMQQPWRARHRDRDVRAFSLYPELSRLFPEQCEPTGAHTRALRSGARKSGQERLARQRAAAVSYGHSTDTDRNPSQFPIYPRKPLYIRGFWWVIQDSNLRPAD
jgi:hypothetical protein